MTKSEQMHARYVHLQGQGRCVRCAEKLPMGCETVRCPRCLEEARLAAKRCWEGRSTFGNLARRKERLNDHLKAVLATMETHTTVQQAEMLGVNIDRVYALRAIARRRGFEISLGPAKTGGGPESPKWSQLDALMASACGVCGLRGDHECLPGIEGFIRSDGGPTYPEGGPAGLRTGERLARDAAKEARRAFRRERVQAEPEAA